MSLQTLVKYRLDKKISASRSRGILTRVILQNLDQLEAVYDQSYETYNW